MRPKKYYFLSDVGGSFVRACIFETNVFETKSGKLVAEIVEPYKEGGQISEIYSSFLSKNGFNKLDFSQILIALPTPILNFRPVSKTWRKQADQICSLFQKKDILFLNDLVSLAWATPVLGAHDVKMKQAGKRNIKDSPTAIISVGTGVGTAFYIPSNKDATVSPSEACNWLFAAANKEEEKIICALRKKIPPQELKDNYALAYYRFLTGGRGFPNLYRVVTNRDELLTSAQIVEKARGGSKPAQRAIDIFSTVLGSLSSHMAMQGTCGKVMISGGTVLGMADQFNWDLFLSRFNHPPIPHLTDQIKETGVYLVTKKNPVLSGLNFYARRMISQTQGCVP